ncbi:hypothetical protein QBC37DRAFT_458657 [Rhypophila decipiens]|uniref:Uncharacterized protein n=1 Tax=Rhypophila decipiens TaxID=261697 RepID=A0AAN6YAI6_9PEZI|nr:hypothetical protein QBC37DRAFT_458657 [Rhypophila decipiens]
MSEERPVANNSVDSISNNQDLAEQGLTPQEQEQARLSRISRPRGALRWLVKKTRELLFIGLVGIPTGQLFLESQSTKPVAGNWFKTACPITWLIWVCIAVLLALDNFDYLRKNKERILGAALGFCAAPTIGRFTGSSFADNTAVFPICLVFAVICPQALKPWTAAEAEQHERLN